MVEASLRRRRAYVEAVTGARDATLTAAHQRAVQAGMAGIEIDDNTGRFLQLLVATSGATRVLEIGTLFGYSTIYLARGLGPEGRLVSLELREDCAVLARQNVAAAGLEDRVQVVTTDALTFLSREEATYDLIFIDGRKTDYVDYLRLSYPRLATGGLLIADDAYADADFSDESEDGSGADAVRAISDYNRAVMRSSALVSAFSGHANGLMVSLKVGR
jgi:caffeoyl-CoA O-methyltransferase